MLLSRLLGCLLILPLCAIAEEVPIGWMVADRDRVVVVLQETHAPTKLESEPNRLSRVREALRPASLYLFEGYQYTADQLGRYCRDELTASSGDFLHEVPAIKAWASRTGIPWDVLYPLLRSHGEHHLFVSGINAVTSMGLAVQGIAPDDIKAHTHELSPIRQLMNEELGRDRFPPAWRHLETYEDSFRAWCAAPRASRAAVLQSKLSLALLQMNVLLTRDPSSLAAAQLARLAAAERLLRWLSDCALSLQPCAMRDEAATTRQELGAGFDRHRAATLLQGRNAAMAEALHKLPAGTYAAVVIGAAHLPDFTHPTLRVTGLLELLRRMGYSVTPIW